MCNEFTCIPGLRLLIIDNDADTREMLYILFNLEGAEALTVGSAREALEVVSDFKPDVLICDLYLSDEMGYSLLPKIRSIEAAKGRWTPAIALTGSTREKDCAYAFTAGFQMYLSKPVNLDELLNKVARLAFDAAHKQLA
ncbi:response regulator [Nostocaceae cyanobacterium CENA357]|uniref:Response regulator n=1 Tax=Atlanticothrix silvestris CENA357 TaxID=1725252 RepID=A0A8J7HI40_9CYAN|nr:response regulator [Atlanticothrix silvestris]MBH8555479.1 response regulator [Atlanticothrix silvestris CENA357]